MDRAWEQADDALRFALGVPLGDMPKAAVLLHKDRLDAIARLAGRGCRFDARWSGLLISDGSRSVAFVATAGGAYDVGDCLLHLAASGLERVLYTGTCGSLAGELELGAVCVVTEGWVADSFVAWMTDPGRAVSGARYVSAGDSAMLRRVGTVLESRCHVRPQRKRVFTTASQALESPVALARMQELGAEVIDMETGVFLTVAQACRLTSAAVLWCTDSPDGVSFYQKRTGAASTVCREMWDRWPAIVLAAGQSLAAEDSLHDGLGIIRGD